MSTRNRAPPDSDSLLSHIPGTCRPPTGRKCLLFGMAMQTAYSKTSKWDGSGFILWDQEQVPWHGSHPYG